MKQKRKPRFLKECPIHGLTEHRGREDTSSARCIQCGRDYMNKRRADLKLKAIEYKGGVCARCGLDSDYREVYEFHHEDPSQKEFMIGHMLAYPWSKVTDELDKCTLLCANCHRIIHANLRSKPA